jgi:hypothetical protein
MTDITEVPSDGWQVIVNQQVLKTEMEYGKELVMRLEVIMKSVETVKSFVMSFWRL